MLVGFHRCSQPPASTIQDVTVEIVLEKISSRAVHKRNFNVYFLPCWGRLQRFIGQVHYKRKSKSWSLLCSQSTHDQSLFEFNVHVFNFTLMNSRKIVEVKLQTVKLWSWLAKSEFGFKKLQLSQIRALKSNTWILNSVLKNVTSMIIMRNHSLQKKTWKTCLL